MCRRRPAAAQYLRAAIRARPDCENVTLESARSCPIVRRGVRGSKTNNIRVFDFFGFESAIAEIFVFDVTECRGRVDRGEGTARARASPNYGGCQQYTYVFVLFSVVRRARLTNSRVHE